MHRKISFKSVLSLMLSTFVIFLIVSCATVYLGSLVKGSVIGAYSSGVFLNIESGRASLGQELNVYKVTTKTQEPLARPISERVLTGKVKITEIFDNQIAKAAVISGKAEKPDIVELVRPK